MEYENWCNKTIDEVLVLLETTIDRGLSETEALRRLERGGANTLRQKDGKSIARLVLEQLNNVLIYILAVAAAVSLLLGETADAVIILVVIVINAVVGVVQEAKAEKSLEALKKLAAPKALVRRDGQAVEIDSVRVVPGDVVLIDAGRIIPADLRLVESANLKIEESSLTGESVPSDKNAYALMDSSRVALGDRTNMAYMSTVATYGRGVGIVAATGMDTQIGRIATMIEESGEELTPLQRTINSFGKRLGAVVVGLCGLMFGISVLQLYLRETLIHTEAVFEALLTAISLAVAAIPEGLPAIVTIVLALGVQRMIREHAIIRRLPAVEILGSVNVVCSDKTGTLTQNRMTVTRTAVSGTEISQLASPDGRIAEDPTIRLLLETMALCNDATAGTSESAPTGDPTEIALVEVAARAGLAQSALAEGFPRVAEAPFDSVRKRMSTVHRHGGGYRVATKGALDGILEVSATVYRNGEVVPLTDEIRREILDKAARMSSDALRVLAAATREISEPLEEPGKLERELTLIGIVGMIDPPRLEVRDSISRCRRSGITTVMITGDHRNTAFAIAKQLGIAESTEQVLSGSDIDDMDESQLTEQARSVRVFARVSPEHKVRIIRAFRALGSRVSMTGDGVNDAPSLKAADVGVAMGITGTDVAKGASDMVLTDDNFSTIVSAIEEGRNIYNNIRKTIIFLLSCNTGEILAVFSAVLLGILSPLRPIHILWVNLITDTLPALSLGVDPGDPDVMDQPPRPPNESLFANGAGTSLVLNGVLIGGITLAAYFLGSLRYGGSHIHGQTFAFAVLSISQLFHGFDLRHGSKSIFSVGVFSNRYLLGSLVIGVLLQFSVIMIPAMASMFSVAPLSALDWALIGALAISPVVLNELAKVGIRRKHGSECH